MFINQLVCPLSTRKDYFFAKQVYYYYQKWVQLTLIVDRLNSTLVNMFK